MFALLSPETQPRLPIHAMHPFVIHLFAAPSQQYMQAPIAPTRLLARQPHQPRPQPFIATPGPIAVTRYRDRHQPTRPPLPDSRLQGCELHPFFRITDCNASLSKLRSATSLFNRAFSSRNCFTSRASLTSIPPYFAFQA